jgi:hypothetical protein
MPEAHANYLRITVVAVCMLIALATASLLVVVVRTVTATTIPFDVDEANHAVNGWELYHAFASRAPQAIYRAIVDQGFYPPVHSFFVATSYALVGPSLAASRMPTVIHFVLTLVLLAWLTFQIARTSAPGAPAGSWFALLGAAFAFAFAITSNIFVTNAVLTMLEMTGAMFGLLLLLGANFLDRQRRNRAAWIGLVGVALLAMLTALTKYSFGLFFLPGLLLAMLTAPWKTGRRAWAAVTAAAVFVFIGGIWFWVTDRTTMILFFRDHPQYAPVWSRENLLYLVHVWLNGYTPSVGIGIIIWLLALVGAVHHWRRLAVRLAVWAVAAGTLVLTVSTTDEPRHFLPLAPLLWMLAGVGLAEALCRLQSKRYGGLAVTGLIVVFLLFLGLGARQEVVALSDELVSELEGMPVHTELYDFALHNVDLTRPVLFIGDLYDQNNLLAIRWQAATLTGRSTWDLDVDYFPFEQYEHSLMRTKRKMQIASAEPSFPRQHMNEVLARNYYAAIVEIKDLKNHYGPRAGNPEDPLCAFPVRETEANGWIVIVYDLDPGKQRSC